MQTLQEQISEYIKEYFKEIEETVVIVFIEKEEPKKESELIRD